MRKNSSTIYTYTQCSKCKFYVNKLYLKTKQSPVLLSMLWLCVWTFMLGWRRGRLFHWLSRHLETKQCVARPWEPFWCHTQSMPLSKWFLSLKSSQDHEFLERRGAVLSSLYFPNLLQGPDTYRGGRVDGWMENEVMHGWMDGRKMDDGWIDEWIR